MGDAMWITLKKGQRVKLQASGETVAAVHGTAIGPDGASIIVETFDRRGPASARPVRFWALLGAKGYEKGHAFRWG